MKQQIIRNKQSPSQRAALTLSGLNLRTLLYLMKSLSRFNSSIKITGYCLILLDTLRQLKFWSEDNQSKGQLAQSSHHDSSLP